jgi:hypothetical protein
VHHNQTFTHHQTLLLQGVVNFFMEQGKIALVASENAATKAWFEEALEHQIAQKLGCELIRLDALTDTLDALNVLLSGVSVQQATRPASETHANFLLWVTESDQFTAERFQVLKKIILQFSGLKLKLMVSVTSDRWNRQLFDIAGQKISYWFIPASVSADLSSASVMTPVVPQEPAHSEAVVQSPVDVADPSEITMDDEQLAHVQQGLYAKAKQRLFKSGGLVVVGLLIFVAAAVVYLNFKSTAEPRKASAPQPVADSTRVAAQGALQANDGQMDQSRSAPSAPTVGKPVVVSDPAGIQKLGSTNGQQQPGDSASQVKAVDSIAEILLVCPQSMAVGMLPTAKPVVFKKETNYIFIKTDQDRAICVAPSGGTFRLVNLRAIKGTRVYGNGPWRVYSPELQRFELYFQGARVMLGPNVRDHVQIIPN